MNSDLIRNIRAIAKKLGIGYDEVLPYMVKKSVTTGVIEIIVTLILISIMAISIVKLNAMIKEKANNDMLVLIKYSLIIIVFVISVILTIDGVNHVINPEMMTIKDLLN